MLLSIALQAAVVHAPFLQAAFRTVPLTLRDWLVCIGVASSVLWLTEAKKGVMRLPWKKWVMRLP